MAPYSLTEDHGKCIMEKSATRVLGLSAVKDEVKL